MPRAAESCWYAYKMYVISAMHYFICSLSLSRKHVVCGNGIDTKVLNQFKNLIDFSCQMKQIFSQKFVRLFHSN